MVASHDPITQWDILRGLRTRYVGRQIVFFPEATSTQEHAQRLARADALEGTLVIADSQTVGRGRLGRSWFSPPGVGIHMTVILRPPENVLPFQLTLLSAVAAAAGISDGTGLFIDIKWPNDLMICGKKTAGILVESQSSGEGMNYAGVGVGINVNTPFELFPPELHASATSLAIEAGRMFARADIVRAVLGYLEHWYDRLKEGDGAALLSAYKALNATVGQEVTVTRGDNSWQGVVDDILDDGTLLLRQPDGCMIRVAAGDVTVRRWNKQS